MPKTQSKPKTKASTKTRAKAKSSSKLKTIARRMKLRGAVNRKTLLVIAGVLLVSGLGIFGWQKHKNNQAHAAGYGAFMGQYLGTKLYACKGTYNIKFTATRSAYDAAHNYPMGVQMSVQGTPDPASSWHAIPEAYGNHDSYSISPNNNNWLIGQVLGTYQSGHNEYIMAYGFKNEGRTYDFSMTSKYDGKRVRANGAYYPATDGLPGC